VPAQTPEFYDAIEHADLVARRAQNVAFQTMKVLAALDAASKESLVRAALEKTKPRIDRDEVFLAARRLVDFAESLSRAADGLSATFAAAAGSI
jgi:hypothetical protein